MTTIYLRSESANPLLTSQIDSNFNNLNVQKVEVAGATQIVYAVPENTAGQVVKRDDSGNFAAGSITANLIGNASTSTKWQTSRSLSLIGDVTGTVANIDGSSNITISTTIQPNSIVLGTYTTGNYVATITGTANRVTVTGSGSETAAVTLSLPQDIHVGANPTFAGVTGTSGIIANNIKIGSTSSNTIDTSAGELIIDSLGGKTTIADNVVVTGSLEVQGTMSTTEAVTFEGPLFSIGPYFNDNLDRGVLYKWNNGTSNKLGFFGYKSASGYFTFIPDAVNTNNVVSGVKGVLDAGLDWSNILNKPDPVITVTLTGDVTGSANATLTDVSNGTITIATTIQADSIVLGTDTIGNYVATVSAGVSGAQSGSSGLTLSGSGEGATVSIAHADTSNVSNLSSNNSENTFVQDINFTFDTYGHVTGATVETSTVIVNDGSFSVLTSSTNSGLSGGGQLGTVNQSTNTSLNIAHSNVISAGNFGDSGLTRTLAFSETFVVPYITYDTNGHITSNTNKTLTLPAQSADFKIITVRDTDSGYTWAETGDAVADTVGDVLTLVSGNNLNIDVDTVNDAIKISTINNPIFTNVTASGNLTVQGDLVVNGDTVSANVSKMTVVDPVITLGGLDNDAILASNDGKDRGVEFRYYDTQSKLGFMGWDNSAAKYVFLSAATNTSETFTGTKATVDALIDDNNIAFYDVTTGNASATKHGFLPKLSNNTSHFLRGDGTWSIDFYPTAFSWVNGTTAGPTGTLSGNGMANVSFGAIPSASNTTSGVITTSAQNIAGIKTFTDTTDSTTVSTGAVIVAGGVGVAKSLNVGLNVTAVDYNSTSDIRLKTNVTSDIGGVDVINQLNPVEFNWIATGKKSSGVIAQEIQEILPHLVSTSPDEIHTVNYIGIIAYLIKAVQELDQKVKQLSGEN